MKSILVAKVPITSWKYFFQYFHIGYAIKLISAMKVPRKKFQILTFYHFHIGYVIKNISLDSPKICEKWERSNHFASDSIKISPKENILDLYFLDVWGGILTKNYMNLSIPFSFYRGPLVFHPNVQCALCWHRMNHREKKI